jgi:tetratricopeptide (TPR) repeat protein
VKHPLLVVVASLVAAGAILAVAAPAGAQSKRYPPEPVDRDREKAQRSSLWEAATNPARAPYGKLVFEATQLLREGTSASALEAVKRLDEAIERLPDESKAYQLRGEARLRLKDWARCADDLASARARIDGAAAGQGAGAGAGKGGPGKGGPGARPSGDVPDARQRTELRRQLGICQARAGRLAEAERTLAEAAVTGNANGEIWTRLGEVRIALGKLEEAIAALESAAEQTDGKPGLIRWLLAGAYDRARRPAEAAEQVGRATALDRSFASLRDEQLPLLGAGEADYLQGLAYMLGERPRPDYALIYFRYFLKAAKDSPWRKRAEEHLRELKVGELPETIAPPTGNAPPDPAVALAAVRKAMPAMRACVAKTPFIIYEVTIVKAGPRTTPSPLERPRTFVPPEAVTVAPTVGLPSVGEVPQADRDGVVRCIEPIASKIAFPAIKEKDKYFKLSFYVVAP